MAAASVGRSDLVQVWTLASLAAKESVQDEMPWSKHPLSAAKMDYLFVTLLSLEEFINFSSM